MTEEQAPSQPRNLLRSISPALVIALIAVVLLAWQWLDTRQRLTALELSLSQKLSSFDVRNVETALTSKKAEEKVDQTTARLAVIEQKLAESQDQLEALQTLYAEFANNREESTISEVEQLLVIASEQLQLASNPKTALIAMQTADSRLQQLDKPQAIQLRKQLAKDIARLQALPAVDVVGDSLRLEVMAAEVEKLPLMSDHHPRVKQTTAPNQQASRWQRLAGEVWQDMRQLIRIERIDRPEPPLLTPEQTFFLRENLRLRLLTARIALLQRDEATYRADLTAAEGWIKQHFDTSDSTVQNTIATMQQLANSSISIQLPDISDTLNAASRYKLFLQKGGK
jgi:uroporphyrin-3 C-methyltransferase